MVFALKKHIRFENIEVIENLKYKYIYYFYINKSKILIK